MRLKIAFLLTGVLLLTGCYKTVEANRIYTVCQVEYNEAYAYNSDMEFVKVNEDGSITQHAGAGLTAKPALTFEPVSGEFTITPTDIPNHYISTLESLEHYVGNMLEDDSVSYEVALLSWREADIFIHGADWHCRCLWDIKGTTVLRG